PFESLTVATPSEVDIIEPDKVRTALFSNLIPAESPKSQFENAFCELPMVKFNKNAIRPINLISANNLDHPRYHGNFIFSMLIFKSIQHIIGTSRTLFPLG